MSSRVSAGSALAISPFLVLFSVFFWTYVWGLFGAFIGVPITIAVAHIVRAASLKPLGRGIARRVQDTGRKESIAGPPIMASMPVDAAVTPHSTPA